jgi:imidazole glycerol phosphate synthase subunit HisF
VAAVSRYDETVAHDIALLRGVLGSRAVICVAGNLRTMNDVIQLISVGADRVALPDPALVLAELGAPAAAR